MTRKGNWNLRKLLLRVGALIATVSLIGCTVDSPIANNNSSTTKTIANNTTVSNKKPSTSTEPITYMEPVVEQGETVDVSDSSVDEELLEEQREELGLDDTGIALAEEENSEYYCFNMMDADKHELYAEIYTILMEEGEDVKLSATSDDELKYVFQCVLNDHPEIYWVDGYSFIRHERGGQIQYYTFSGKYTYSISEREAIQSDIDAYVISALAGVSSNASEYEKVKHVYEYIIDTTEYDLEAVDNQNILSVMRNGRSVCAGYAKTMQYLLYELDVECTFVVGTVYGGQGHAWNLVNINNAYYYVDPTWGDASYFINGQSADNIDMPMNYDYLNITSQELIKTHSIDNVVPMPMCISDTANYYVVEGALFYSYDYSQMYNLFDKAYKSGKKVVTVKCSSQFSFESVRKELIDNQQIFEFLHGESVSYTIAEDAYSMNFWL